MGKRVFLTLAFWFTSLALAAQDGLVVTDGAMVYEGPSFDAKVIGYLNVGRKIKISDKTTGPFYKVQLNQGVKGSVADTDVGPARVVEQANRAAGQPQPGQKIHPIGGTTSLGVSGGYLDFREVINKQQPNEGLATYGLKATFPAGILDGPFFMDVNLFGHSGAPSYYKKFNPSDNPGGFILMMDVQMHFPLFDFSARQGMFYLGGGPLFSYSEFRGVTVGTTQAPLQELKVGASFTLGVARRFDRVILRIEPKYYVERTSFWGVQAGLQYIL